VADGVAWIVGTAVLLHDGAPAWLPYEVACDARWITRRARIRGWVGARDVDLTLVRAADGAWTCDGVPVRGLDGCVDVDLGFTPATNVIPIRRLALAVGAAADAPAAWLDAFAGTLTRLDQRYERRTERTYRYEAPAAAYAALLETTADGLVRTYPGLWAAVEAPERAMRLSHVNVTIPPGGEEAARAFYGALLGLHEVPKPEAMRSTGGVWFDAGGLDLHLSVETGRGQPDARRHFGLACGDVDGLRARLHAAGVATEDGRPAPWRRFFLRDPFGNRIEIHAPEAFGGS
jgi:catechol 2,3-dioxygenase-like lactoylglutathione lyase family enzyme